MGSKLAICSIALFLSYLVQAIEGVQIAGRDKGDNISSIDSRYVKATIQAEDGDVYDCIDIHRQPALSHPLLTDHVIRMEPTSYPSGLEIQSELPANISQAQLPNIRCPKGTIPILRKAKVHKEGTIPLIDIRAEDAEGEKAAIRYWDDHHGMSASINIYEPLMTRTDGDLTAAWAQINNGPEAIGAGSMVWPKYMETPLPGFIFTGSNKVCYDHDCPGFVQVEPNAPIGGRLTPVSTIDGHQYEFTVVLFQRDKNLPVAYLFAQRDKNLPVGYRPLGRNALPLIQATAVLNERPGSRHERAPRSAPPGCFTGELTWTKCRSFLSHGAVSGSCRWHLVLQSAHGFGKGTSCSPSPTRAETPLLQAAAELRRPNESMTRACLGR
ncbi:hypothetical protein ACP4OV_000780 [Aristida adscensionis]